MYKMSDKHMALTDTLSGDTCTPCHGDLNGDAVGDPVTGDLKRNQGVNLRATHLGSVANLSPDASTCRVTPRKQSLYPL